MLSGFNATNRLDTSARPTSQPVSMKANSGMSEGSYPTLINQEVITLIKNELREEWVHIVTRMIVILKQSREDTNNIIQDAIDRANDLAWLTNQDIVSNLTNPGTMRRLRSFIFAPDKTDTRLNFILRLTNKLKFQLGKHQFNQLIEDIFYALSVVDVSQLTESDYFTQLNQDLITPNKDMLMKNHWMIPIVICGIAIPKDFIHVLQLEFQENLTIKSKRTNAGSR